MRMDSEGILHFSFFFYALMKGRIATISFGCLWINKFKKGGTHMKETKIYADEFCTTFASTTEMLEFLAERAKQSKWIRKPTRMLKLVLNVLNGLLMVLFNNLLCLNQYIEIG